MTSRTKGRIFAIAYFLGLGALFLLSGGPWSRTGQYLVLDQHERRSGADSQPLAVFTQSGETLSTVEVPADTAEKALVGDVLDLRTRRIPGAGRELLQYRLLRAGQEIAAWSVDIPYYLGSLVVGALLLAFVVLLLASAAGAVFGRQAPGR